MTIDKAIEVLRENNVDVVQTLEEYFVQRGGRLVMVSENTLKKMAKAKVQEWRKEECKTQ